MHRTIGVVLGGLLTYLLLLLFTGPDGTWRIVSDSGQAYLVSVVLGGIMSWAWPVVIAWWLVRRRRDREQDRIQSEVERQVAQQTKRPG